MEKNKKAKIPFDPENLEEQPREKPHAHTERHYIKIEDPGFVPEEDPFEVPEKDPDYIPEEDPFEVPQYEPPIEGEGP